MKWKAERSARFGKNLGEIQVIDNFSFCFFNASLIVPLHIYLGFPRVLAHYRSLTFHSPSKVLSTGPSSARHHLLHVRPHEPPPMIIVIDHQLKHARVLRG